MLVTKKHSIELTVPEAAEMLSNRLRGLLMSVTSDNYEERLEALLQDIYSFRSNFTEQQLIEHPSVLDGFILKAKQERPKTTSVGMY